MIPGRSVVFTPRIPPMEAPRPASNEGTKKEDGKRPSRLLNLNKSPQAQKLLQVLPFSLEYHIHVANTVYG
jgi:hypothetical protein